MIDNVAKKAIETVKKFNEDNRFRDCGRINNAIDVVLALVDKQEQENKLLKLKLKQLKFTRDLLSEHWDEIFEDNEDENEDI